MTKDEITNREWETLGRLVDMQLNLIAGKLINMEAYVNTFGKKQTCTEAIQRVHKRAFESWEEHLALSEKLDKIRGISK